jgi:hypothetical protein
VPYLIKVRSKSNWSIADAFALIPPEIIRLIIHLPIGCQECHNLSFGGAAGIVQS